MELQLAFGVFVLTYVVVLAVIGMIVDFAVSYKKWSAAAAFYVAFVIANTFVGSVVVDLVEMVFLVTLPLGWVAVLAITAVLAYISFRIFNSIKLP